MNGEEEKERVLVERKGKTKITVMARTWGRYAYHV